MKDKIVIGVDTSNYTTSLALLRTDGTLLENLKMPLPVQAGERGLRQSDAVFFHVRQLAPLFASASKILSRGTVVAVGVSATPRRAEGSYMPCFLSGVASAQAVASATGAPLFTFSHQCGHLMAALFSADRMDVAEKPFGAFHVSGGTTELLRVSAEDGYGFDAELVGETKDLNAGQVIDRVGVAMGLSFPAGAELEKLAMENTARVPRRRLRVENCSVNLSGLENLSLRLYHESGSRALCAAFVFGELAETIRTMGEQYEARYGKMPMVFAGGVMSNVLIRRVLEARFEAVFAEPELSRDNAVGVAALALRRYLATCDNP